jgi:hypothetical protein
MFRKLTVVLAFLLFTTTVVSAAPPHHPHVHPQPIIVNPYVVRPYPYVNPYFNPYVRPYPPVYYYYQWYYNPFTGQWEYRYIYVR